MTRRGGSAAVVLAAALVASCAGSSDTASDDDPTDATTSPTTTAAPTDSTAASVNTPTSTPTTTPPTTAPPPPQEHWISVRDGQWIDRRTGEVFVPRGVNLQRRINNGGDQLFGRYDPEWVAEQLDEMADLGVNTVRFFLDLCMTCTADADGVRPEYLDDLTDLLGQMAERGIVALPTSNDVPDPGYSERLPCCEPFGGYRNSLYLAPDGHTIAAEYFTDLIEGLQARGAPLHVVMGWQLANEQFFLRDVPPISLTSGTATTADGNTYDLSDDAAVVTMVRSNLLAYIDHVGSTIRSLDEGALVTMGFFPADEPGAGRVAADHRWVEPELVMREGAVDFIDLHAYPGLGGRWDLIGPAYGLDEPPAIPLLLGEYGAFNGSHLSVDEAAIAVVDWQVESCDWGFAGWLAWLWGEQTDPEVITLNSGDAELATAVSPITRPDPCDPGPYTSPNLALNRPVTASQEELGNNDEYRARSVNDGSIRTWWSAADGAPQWVEIDLGSERLVGRVEIHIGDVTPRGRQTHLIHVRNEGEPAPGRLVGEATGDVRDGDILTVEVDADAIGPVRYVRIDTVEIDGWVIVHDVAVFAP
ncbi:MAG: discoidin domain-containing protein [Ilumatobacteraceae bacterium]|nr:discoidin domain-containing protein [Ilumatobacteraceae bacterium]